MSALSLVCVPQASVGSFFRVCLYICVCMALRESEYMSPFSALLCYPVCRCMWYTCICAIERAFHDVHNYTMCTTEWMSEKRKQQQQQSVCVLCEVFFRQFLSTRLLVCRLLLYQPRVELMCFCGCLLLWVSFFPYCLPEINFTCVTETECFFSRHFFSFSLLVARCNLKRHFFVSNMPKCVGISLIFFVMLCVMLLVRYVLCMINFSSTLSRSISWYVLVSVRI